MRSSRGLSQWLQLYPGAQINFGDQTPYGSKYWQFFFTDISFPFPCIGVDGELADAGAGLEAVLPGLVPPPPPHQTLTHLLIWSRYSNQGFYQRNGEYKCRSHLRRFCHYPHRGVDEGRHSCETTEYKSTDSPKEVEPSRTSAWHGWKQPDISV
jgi:hypothetical protein